jgi:chromosomal replication initiator protein
LSHPSTGPEQLRPTATPADAHALWHATLEQLRSATERRVVTSWFEPLRPASALDRSTDPARLVLIGPDASFIDALQRRFGAVVRQAVAQTATHPVQLVFMTAAQAEDAAITAADDSDGAAQPHGTTHAAGTRSSAREAPGSSMRQGALPIGTPAARPPRADDGLQRSKSFDAFLVGDANAFAQGAAQTVVQTPGALYNPLFVHGPVGVGKTHLLNAIGLAAQRRDPNLRVRYVAASAFIDDVVSAFRSRDSNARSLVRDRYRHVDMLLVDDVQFLDGKTHTQEEFFHTFNALHHAGKQVVLSADRFPEELKRFEDRLRSRLGWGLVAELHPPDPALRREMLHRFATERGIELPADVVSLVADHLGESVRALEGAINKLLAYHRISGRTIDLALARQVVLPQLHRSDRAPTMRNIQKLVAQHFDVVITELKGDRRTQRVARPRMIAMYLCREALGASYPEIGRAFGGRDHSTAVHACKRTAAWLETEDPLAEDIRRLRRSLGLR